jgi:predicted RNA-binding Zn ribbon-like protein
MVHMTASWTRHRFSGGALALDVTNTVVHRGEAMRSFDRFEDAAEIARFASAASGFRAAELGYRNIVVSDPEGIRGKVLAIRETADALFRHTARSESLDTTLLPPFLRACADALDEQKGASTGSADPPIAFEAALALSALSLLSERNYARIRICPNCNWLFLDGSRNGSRLWCDMAVCGNRHKAKRHYRRRKAQREGNHQQGEEHRHE